MKLFMDEVMVVIITATFTYYADTMPVLYIFGRYDWFWDEDHTIYYYY